MNVVPSLKPINFEYSAYDGQGTLSVGMRVYDLSTGSAVLVTAVPMTHVFNGTYWGTYTFPANSSGKNYLIQKSVYTTNSYAIVSTTYSPGSDIVEIDGFDNNSGRVT